MRKAGGPQDSHLCEQNSDSLMNWEWARGVGHSVGSRMQKSPELRQMGSCHLPFCWEQSTLAPNRCSDPARKETHTGSIHQPQSTAHDPLHQQVCRPSILPGQERHSSEQKQRCVCVIDMEFCILGGLQTASLKLTKNYEQKQNPHLHPASLVLCAY